jgi:hypothetical protein
VTAREARLGGVGVEFVDFALSEKRTLEDCVKRFEEEYPGQPVRTDLLSLVRRLNSEGFLNCQRPQNGLNFIWTTLSRGWPWAGSDVIWSVVASGLVARRRSFDSSRGRLFLIIHLLCALAAPFALVAAVVGVLARTMGSPIWPMESVLCFLVGVVSVIAHEIAHTVSARRFSVIVSLGVIRVLRRKREDVSLGPVLAGPIMGVFFGLLFGAVGLGLSSPLVAAVAAAVALGHLVNLTPWTWDGKRLWKRLQAAKLLPSKL